MTRREVNMVVSEDSKTGAAYEKSSSQAPKQQELSNGKSAESLLSQVAALRDQLAESKWECEQAKRSTISECETSCCTYSGMACSATGRLLLTKTYLSTSGSPIVSPIGTKYVQIPAFRRQHLSTNCQYPEGENLILESWLWKCDASNSSKDIAGFDWLQLFGAHNCSREECFCAREHSSGWPCCR